MTSLITMRCDNTRVVPPMETIEVEEYSSNYAWLCDSGSTTPGDDIWTKFGMEETESIYPTPPLSPENKPYSGDMCWQDLNSSHHQTKADIGLTLDYHQTWHPEHSVDITPLLELDSEMESSKIIQECTQHDNYRKPKSELKVSLIQDCMWSAYKKLLLKDSEKTHTNNVRESSQENMYSEFSQPSDCVDPTTVFPYPLSITETQLDLNLGGQSSSHSDSEEEIDVVTIGLDSAVEDKKKSSKRESHKHKHRRIYEITNPEHDYAKPGPKHPHKLGRSFKRSKSSSTPQNLLKRKRSGEGVNPIALKKALEGYDKSRVLGMYNPASSRGSSKNSSRCSSQGGSHSASDSEDCDKRVNHNVLERKRREDLRSAFFRLRDRIPELESKERASKVVILEKSRTYVMKLRKDQMELLHKKEVLANKNKELLAKLRKLRTR